MVVMSSFGVKHPCFEQHGRQDIRPVQVCPDVFPDVWVRLLQSKGNILAETCLKQEHLSKVPPLQKHLTQKRYLRVM